MKESKKSVPFGILTSWRWVFGLVCSFPHVFSRLTFSTARSGLYCVFGYSPIRSPWVNHMWQSGKSPNICCAAFLPWTQTHRIAWHLL
jgi:hypothetical protein